ncbi:MAG: hypothetical protein INQ03_01700 [Candidatus Heimdallarchaeota archaeon]|nr:hypothetical protein [Candidatus Heimdallarchaeota archaeon]
MKVFLDTNVLLHADTLTQSIEDSIRTLIGVQVEILIHPAVEAEIIDSLLEVGKKGNQANFAMKFMSLFGQYLDEKEYSGTDTALLISAKREGACVFTLDLGLKRRCLANGVPVISSFKKGRLKLYGQDFQ